MKKHLAMLVFLVLWLIFAVPSALASENAQGFAGGSGTEQSPYLIENGIQLDNIRNYPNAHFKVICDIILTDEDYTIDGFFYNSGKGWTPIGTKAEPFSGVFDGNGHDVVGLWQKTLVSGDVYAGLFGYTDSAVIKNIHMKNSDLTISTINGSAYGGGIAAYLQNTSVLGCSAEGNIYIEPRGSGSYRLAGGIVGFARNTVIDSCRSASDIIVEASGSPSAGGIAGGTAGCTITNCYNTGTLSVNATNSGSAGVSAYPFVGTRFAASGSTPSYVIKNSYGIGKIYGREGVIDHMDYCVMYDSEGVLTELTPDEMCMQGTYEGFDFENIWQMGNGDTYPLPTLRGIDQPSPSKCEDFDGGIGMVCDPYLVSDKYQLDNMRNYPGAYFELTRDIAFGDADFAEGGAFYNNGRGWISIGDSEIPFAGSFDGKGHTVSGLYQRDPSPAADSYYGLFGNTKGIELKDLKVTDADIYLNTAKTVDVYGGFLVGYAWGGFIDNCHVSGSMDIMASKCYDLNLGGILGKGNAGISISGCSNFGNIKGVGINGYIGGIAADLCNSDKASASVTDCCNMGDISLEASGGSSAGGVLGKAYNSRYNPLVIKNCINTGSVTSKGRLGDGNGSAGGIAGNVTYATVSGCCNKGDVSITQHEQGARAGGILGSISSGSQVTDCYNTGAVSAYMDFRGAADDTGYSYSGGIAGFSSASIINCYNIAPATAKTRPKTKPALEGAIVGSNSGSVSSCYYLMISNSGDGSDTAVSLTAAQMKVSRMFAGFDFTAVWRMGDGGAYEYPTLRGLDDVHFAHIFECETVSDAYLASEATCISPALYYKSCLCGAKGSETFAYGSKLDHSFTEYVYNNDAACNKNGTETAECDNIGCEEKDTREAAGTKLDHSYGEWFTVTEASYTEVGEEKRVCTYEGCEAFETQIILPTGPELCEKIAAIYDADANTVILLNVPKNLKVLLAIYDGDQMVRCAMRSNASGAVSFVLTEGYKDLNAKVFFLTQNWQPIGKFAELDF